MSVEEAERAMGLITISKDEGVAHVQLARPTRLNAIDNALFAALIEAGEGLRQDQGLRAVVLSGQGRAFCAGLDMDLFRGMVDGSGRNVGGAPIMPRRYGHANGPQQAILTWRALPVPVIAAIHGVAFGAGLQLALAADIRVATPDARLSALEMKWGLVPDLGGFAIMRRLTGDDRLRELVYTARVLSGTEAQRYGLVTQVADDALGSALIGQAAAATGQVTMIVGLGLAALAAAAWSHRFLLRPALALREESAGSGAAAWERVE